MENKRSHRQSHRKKVLPEIYLTRLLSTKVTIVKRPKAKTKHKSSLCSIFYYLYLFQKPHRNSFVAWNHVSAYLWAAFYLFLHRELFRSSWMTSFRPSSASLQTALLWLLNTFLTSWRNRLTNGASQTQTPCTFGRPTGRQLNGPIKILFGQPLCASAFNSLSRSLSVQFTAAVLGKHPEESSVCVWHW